MKLSKVDIKPELDSDSKETPNTESKEEKK